MDVIVNQFFQDLDDIENFDFTEYVESVPKTDWKEQLDARTSFPFYWNAKTNECVWDMPVDYEEYQVKLEAFLREINEKLRSKREEQDKMSNNIDDIRGLIGYSDSEDEELIVEEIKCDDELKSDDPVVTEVKEEEIDEGKWMSNQVDEAESYLQSLIKDKTEMLIRKVRALNEQCLGNDKLRDIAVRMETRLEDWEGGYLTLDRIVDKLQESLIELAFFEAGLSSNKWHWDNQMNIYCRKLPEITIEGSTCQVNPMKNNGPEEGEIIDDEDIAQDLEEYISSTLQERNSDMDQNGIESNESVHESLRKSEESTQLNEKYPQELSDKIVAYESDDADEGQDEDMVNEVTL